MSEVVSCLVLRGEERGRPRVVAINGARNTSPSSMYSRDEDGAPYAAFGEPVTAPDEMLAQQMQAEEDQKTREGHGSSLSGFLRDDHYEHTK